MAVAVGEEAWSLEFEPDLRILSGRNLVRLLGSHKPTLKIRLYDGREPITGYLIPTLAANDFDAVEENFVIRRKSRSRRK